MSSTYYQLRIRNAADLADELTVTSVRGGTNPYIAEPPSGDGQGFNPRTGATEVGAYTVRITDNGSTASAITGFLADAFSRYDKLGRRAYVAYGSDGATFPNLLVAGYITDISFPSAAEAQVTVGEAQRSERTKRAFATASDDFPATTMLAGGPIRTPATFAGPIGTDFGPWTMRVLYNDTVSIATVGFVSGFVLAAEDAIDYTRREGAIPQYTYRQINAVTVSEPRTPFSTITVSGFTYAVSRVGNVYADLYQDGAYLETVPVLSGLGEVIDYQGVVVLNWTTAASVGDEYQVYLYTRTISEASPLHLYDHPVDIITGLITEAGDTYDGTTAAAVKASVGGDVLVFLRLTESSSIKDFIDNLLGVFGLGRRIDSNNQWVFFDQRAKSTSAPANTITLASLRDRPLSVWSLQSSSIVNTVTVTQQRFAKWAPGSGGTRPSDGLLVVEQKRTARYQLSDGTFPDETIGVHELSYMIPGTITNAQSGEIDLTQFTTALAAPAFDRWGGGAPRTTLACLDSVTDQVGDEVTLSLNFLPTVNTRGSSRIVQVVQRTNEPGGPVLVVEDAGSSAQPATAPTFTITANAVHPNTQADVTLTNAAALVASTVTGVIVEWIVSAGAPAVAGQDLGSITPADPLVLVTPPVAAGSKVWARAKSIQPGKRAGTFTAWASVTLTAVGAPGALAFTANGLDGSKGTLDWTVGSASASFGVRVLLRLAALTADADLRVADLLPGSVLAPLVGMTPSASYTATVQYIDPDSGIVAASDDVTFSAGGTTLTLSPPTDEQGVVGSPVFGGGIVAVLDGTYGLNVSAVHLPGTVEFWEAVETGVGAGTFGTSVLVSTVPSSVTGPTEYRSIAPNDGLLRRLTARHVAVGATASAYTTVVDLDAWAGVIQAITTPSLIVTSTPDPVTWSIVWSGSGTITVSIDGAAYGAPAASPISVPLDTDSHTYTFRAVLNGQTIVDTVNIPALASTGPTFSGLSIGAPDYVADTVDIDWTGVNVPGGATYNLAVFEQTSVSDPAIGNTASFTGVTAPYTYSSFNDLDALGPRTKLFLATVTMVSGDTVVATSTQFDATFNSN